jgi:general nucleoside transport system ATP-binding protein
MNTTPRLELAAVTKRYPGVLANDRVSLRVMPGEIHAILGENGAGKSTLMKIIYGAVRPDSGDLVWDGREVLIGSPRDARALGISMVFQHFALFDSLTVAENVWLGLDGTVSRRALRARIAELSRMYDLRAPAEGGDRGEGGPLAAGFAERRVSELSVGERQRVEILRALFTEPRLLILDEPTSVLTPVATERLFVTLRSLAAAGCSILYISHKLDEVRALCERCTVLRGGRVTGEIDPRTATNARLSEMMLGAQPPARVSAGASQLAVSGGQGAPSRAPALEVRALSRPSREPFGVALANVSFTLHAGAILGIAGISGSGQSELMNAISGEDPGVPAGSIRIAGEDVSRRSTRARRALGLCTVPEERIGRGAVPTLSLAANTLLTRRDAVARSGLLRWPVARALAAKLIARFRVRAVGADVPAGSLSGGNLQKFIVGREIDAAPKVLVVAQPTWGLDVGAAAEIRNDLAALASQGVAVLVISEDLPELLELCTDVVVLARGRLSPRVTVGDATIAEIGEWMSGLFPDPPAPERSPPFPISSHPASDAAPGARGAF